MRIAKRIAMTGVCSRREAERWIEMGRVSVEGRTIHSPALNVDESTAILIDGKPLGGSPEPEIIAFYKPNLCITSRGDPQGRETIYNHLPKKYHNFHPIGRLDYNSEGLLLLTNQAAVKRHFELPENALARDYRVRMRGTPSTETLYQIESGVTIEGIEYRPAKIVLEKKGNSNHWYIMTIREGKNREIRKILEHFGHPVNRLVRVAYGHYKLDKLLPGQTRQERLPKLVTNPDNR